VAGWLRPLSAGLLAVAAATFAGGAGAAPVSAAPGEVFDRYLAAVHAADMPAVRALIAPDVERSDFAGCRPEMDNPACLAHYLAVTVVEPRARLTVLQRQVQGDTVTARVEVRSSLYTAAGVDRIVGQDVLRAQGGLIHAFRFVPDFGDAQTVKFFGTLGIGPGASRPAASAP
jgi:hypothetical protein